MKNSRPYPPEIVASGVKQRQISFSGAITSKGIRGVMIGLLNDFCGGDDGRYEVLEFLFGKASTKDLDDSQWYALKEWINPGKVMAGNGEVWAANRGVKEECLLILQAMGYNIPDQRESLKKKHVNPDESPAEMVANCPTELRNAIWQAESEGFTWEAAYPPEKSGDPT